MEFAAGGVARALLLLRAVVKERATFLVDGMAQESVSGPLSERRVVVEMADDLSAQRPEIVHVPANGLRGKTRCCQVLDEGAETHHQSFTRRKIFFQPHPGARPMAQIAAGGRSARWALGKVALDFLSGCKARGGAASQAAAASHASSCVEEGRPERPPRPGACPTYENRVLVSYC